MLVLCSAFFDADDFARLAPVVDGFSLMTYDFSSSGYGKIILH